LKRVIIIGGGLAGLISSIELARAGIFCRVIEKRTYPFHRVCGEYVSNEVVPFLKSAGLYPGQFNPPVISKFQLSSVNGKSEVMPLDLGGFGISRYSFDHFLYERAKELGITLIDATCPVVAKVQERIRKFYTEGYQVVIFGKKEHAEAGV